MNRDHLYLSHILKNLSHVERLSAAGKAAFMTNEDTQAAILYYLQTLAESTLRLSETSKADHPEVEWHKIKGFRNIVVHEYLSVDLDLVWIVIMEYLPVLRAAVESLLASLDSPDENS